MIRIPKKIYEEMIEHAKREWPLECCGILGGRDQTVSAIFQLKNIEESPVKYSISPKEQLKAFEEMEKQKIEMLAIYHSHPRTSPYPSRTDIELAYYPEVITVIISLKDRENPLTKAFRIEEENVYQEEIQIIEEPDGT